MYKSNNFFVTGCRIFIELPLRRTLHLPHLSVSSP
jgi:hypothetical protein